MLRTVTHQALDEPELGWCWWKSNKFMAQKSLPLKLAAEASPAGAHKCQPKSQLFSLPFGNTPLL